MIGFAVTFRFLHLTKWVIFLLIALSKFSTAQALPQVPDTLAQRLLACTACHGKDGRAASDGYYPRIAGKPEGYLFNQLNNFRDGKRTYPLMTYMVSHLSQPYLQEIAHYFSEQHPPYAAPQKTEASPALLERGRVLIQQGDALKKIPACVSCHGKKMTGVAPFIPGLLGLPRDYIVAQLGAWQTGSRHAQVPDCMQQIAKQISAQDIAALSNWLAAQTMPLDSIAVSMREHDQYLGITPSFDPKQNSKLPLPLTCGSVR